MYLEIREPGNGFIGHWLDSGNDLTRLVWSGINGSLS